MIVEYAGGMKLVVRHRGLDLVTDQPRSGGGEDTAMTPTEAFVASLAACVGVYVLSFAKRHEILVEGLKIAVDWQMAEGPRRVGAIQVDVQMPEDLDERHRAALQRVAEHCVVHNTLHHTPEVAISVS